MTLNEFSNFIVNNVSKDASYSNMVDTTTMENVKLLQTMSNTDIINKKMNTEELSAVLGINKEVINQVLLLKNIIENPVANNSVANNSIANISTENNYANINIANQTISPYEFVKFIVTNSSNENIANNIPAESLSKLKTVYGIMESSNSKTSYTYSEIAKFIGTDEGTAKKLYALYASNNTELKLAPVTFVDFILQYKDDKMLNGNINSATVENLKLVDKIMESALNNKKYSVAEMSSLLNLDKNDIKLLYSLYSAKHVNSNMQASLKEFVSFTINNVVTNEKYSNKFDNDKITKLNTINGIMNAAINQTKYNPEEIFGIISKLTDSIDQDTIDILYIYYGSENYYNKDWQLTIEELINYVSDNILQDSRFDDFIDDDMKNKITDSKTMIQDNKKMLVGDEYSRIVLNTKFNTEGEETFGFLQKIYDNLGGEIYFIAILIVQSILMGATIDYAILYTSYYKESRETMDIKEAVINSYNKSINTILTSSSILIIATFLVGKFASAIVAKICATLSQGVLCSTILILLVLPAVLAVLDRFVIKKKKL